MGAGHGHSHGVGGHSPDGAGPPRSRVRKMIVALAVLVVFLVVELTVALAIGSLGLLADAGHMLTDVLGMSMGLIALVLARKGSAAAARTFGWHRAEVLTAIANAVLLLGVAAFIMYEAISRIGDAPEIPGLPLILTAAAGLAANIVVMMLIRGDAKDSLAVRGAYMEVLADAVGSVGVLVGGVLMLVFGWTWVDIVVGVLISLWVVPRAIKLAGSALRILTQASPADDRRSERPSRSDGSARPACVDPDHRNGRGHGASGMRGVVVDGARSRALAAVDLRTRPCHRAGRADRTRPNLQGRAHLVTVRTSVPGRQMSICM